MINTDMHNELISENLFPGQIKVYRIDSLKNKFPGSSLLHRHFRQPLTETMQQELAKEIAVFLADKKTAETYSFFYRSINKDGTYEWHITATRLNKDGNGQPKEVVMFTHDLHQLGELKNRLYRVLENDGFFKENFNKISSLTKREKEIAALLATGLNSPEIAVSMHLSVHTVNTHRKRINDKLAIHNFAGLLKFAEVFDLTNH